MTISVNTWCTVDLRLFPNLLNILRKLVCNQVNINWVVIVIRVRRITSSIEILSIKKVVFEALVVLRLNWSFQIYQLYVFLESLEEYWLQIELFAFTNNIELFISKIKFVVLLIWTLILRLFREIFNSIISLCRVWFSQWPTVNLRSVHFYF